MQRTIKSTDNQQFIAELERRAEYQELSQFLTRQPRPNKQYHALRGDLEQTFKI